MRYHRRFRHIHARTVEASRELVRGWGTANDTERWEKMNGWLVSASRTYGMRPPVLTIDRRAGAGFYDRGKNQIHMAYPSIVTLMHEFRHAMQRQEKATGWDGSWANIEEDARGWSLSLYFKTAPRLFRRLVAEGRVLFITVEDLAPRTLAQQGKQ